MTIKTRRILFYILFFLFILIGGALTAYSLGIKLDFTTFSLSKTGGIYLKSEPPDTYIFLDGVPVENKSGFLQSGTLIDNLEKGFYQLSLKRDGYFDWEKEVKVQPSFVEVFDSIVLVARENPEWLTNPATNFYVSGEGIIVERDGKIIAGEAKLIGNKVEDFVEDGAIVTYNESNKTYYLSDLFTLGSSLNVNSLFNNLKESRLGLMGAVPLVKVGFHPFNHKKLIVQSRGALYNLDTSRLTIEQISEGVNDFNVKGEDIVFYDANGIYKYNLIFRTKSRLMEFNGGINSQVKKLEIDAAGRTVLLLKNGKLSLLSNENKRTDVADKAGIMSASSDGRFIAFADYDGPLYVYRIDKKEYLKLNANIDEAIKDLSWYKDNKHLFILTSSGLYFTEVDDDLPLNTIKLAADVSVFKYVSSTDSLYFGSEGGIYRYKMER